MIDKGWSRLDRRFNGIAIASRLFATFLAVVPVSAEAAWAQMQLVVSPDTIGSVVIHPVVRQHFVCLEHTVGQLTHLGDAVGSDCLVIDLGNQPTNRFPSFYGATGSRNADWYGWNQTVLAPFDGIVDSVHKNETVNVPGTLGSARAAGIVFLRGDGVRVLYAHLHAIEVAPGDSVRAGQPVGRIGNNGPSIMPHAHIGAWREREPLQIRFDLRPFPDLRRQSETVPAAPLPAPRPKSR